MHKQISAVFAAATFLAGSAFARERPVTAEERAKLTAAAAAQGCSGGRMEFDIDDNYFEVDDARCGDGREYSLRFDTSFKLIDKKLD